MKTLILLLAFPFTLMASPLNCFDIGKARGLTNGQAIQLCRGAENNAPIICFDYARSRIEFVGDRIELCKKARDTSPLNCFDSAIRMRGLREIEAIVLCSQG